MNIENKIFVVSRVYCECWDIVDNDTEKVLNAINRATEFYKRDVELYKSHIVDYPDRKDYWQKQLERCEEMLNGGWEGVSFDEYNKRQREKWVSKEAKEITEEQWDYALNVLPPLNWHRCDECQFFFMQEFLSGNFTEEYYHDYKSGKYYCKTVDYTDKSTWIEL